MLLKLSFAICFLALCVFTANVNSARAQTPPPKFEFGTHFSVMHFSDLDFTDPGFGFRLTYNVNKHLALEAEGNIFPRDPQDYFKAFKGSHKTQALFGIKAGKRGRRFGFFGKVRPGFINFSNFYGSFQIGDPTPPKFEFKQTDFALDAGGVVEYYTSPRTFIRVDAGDTIIHSSSDQKIELANGSDSSRGDFVIRSVKRGTSHNLQLNIGLGFRLFNNAESAEPVVSRSKLPNYEIGVQFGSLSINPHSPICFAVCVGGPIRHTEPGGGLRFTYNLNSNVAVEAEGNLFPRDPFVFSLLVPHGRMAQAQFGPKIGKRFAEMGVFGKFRPGFVSFSRVSYLISSRVIDFFDRQFTVGTFGEQKRRFFSTDVGGVFEFYASRNVVARVDLGDTIIRYGEIFVPSFILSQNITRVAPETRHNFQFTAGVGFRF